MLILFSRHGDTFEPGDKVVWVGAANDLPLAKRGHLQAKALAKSLSASKILPARIVCGPLSRTKEYAEIVRSELRIKPELQVDSRLHELDYGLWSGLSSEEIGERFGDSELNAWEQESRWPSGAGWSGSEAEVLSELKSLVSDLKKAADKKDLVLCITSNGRLRTFLKLIPDEFSARKNAQTMKVKTGNICLVRVKGDELKILAWNEPPEKLSEKISG
jgi:probable phosphoglycerate mutase